MVIIWQKQRERLKSWLAALWVGKRAGAGGVVLVVVVEAGGWMMKERRGGGEAGY